MKSVLIYRVGAGLVKISEPCYVGLKKRPTIYQSNCNRLTDQETYCCDMYVVADHNVWERDLRDGAMSE